MSYRLENEETLADGVRRIAFEQIDEALGYTKALDGDLDHAIHETRVCCKRLRGLLRFVRYHLGAENYQAENTYYRDAGRRLSAVRDKAVLIETLDNLQERFADQFGEEVFKSLREVLQQSIRDSGEDKTKNLADIAASLPAAAERVEQWPIGPDDFSRVGRGLRRVYKRGHSGLATACEEQSVEAFHEWRKQVKYLWYQVRLLRVIWPEPLKILAEELKTLSRQLSADHDLAILREKVLEQPPSDQIANEILVVLIDQRRSELEASARLLGKRIYADKPGAFLDRFSRYWQTWQSEKADQIYDADRELVSSAG